MDQGSRSGELNLTWNFINGSKALGVLLVSYSLMLDADVHYDVILRPTTHPRTQTTLLPDLPGNKYNISMFVLQENGLPFIRSVAKPLAATVSGGKGKTVMNVYHDN